MLGDLSISKVELDKLAITIALKVRSKSLTHRSITVSNNKLVHKVAQVQSSVRSDAGLFSGILTLKRRQLKHRGIISINASDRDWLLLKEVCGLATEFVNEFGLDKKRGYDRYIQLALAKMKNYSLNKFKSMHPSICKEYEAIQEIELDDKPQKTAEMEEIFLAMVAERTGWSKTYKEDSPEKYAYFVKARKEAESFNVSLKVYIASQFSWFDSVLHTVPDPVQLVGVKAIERLQKYCYEQNIKMGKAANKKSIDWGKIKNHG